MGDRGVLAVGVALGEAYRICCWGKHIGVPVGVQGVGVCWEVGAFEGTTLLVEIVNHFQVGLIAVFRSFLVEGKKMEEIKYK